MVLGGGDPEGVPAMAEEYDDNAALARIREAEERISTARTTPTARTTATLNSVVGQFEFPESFAVDVPHSGQTPLLLPVSEYPHLMQQPIARRRC
jgi:hypothetical protein